jgi:CO/xanthine dehydrogenase Mo-binding subunit
MDELAYATGVDPVALRLLNDTEIDPQSGRPFSTRAMRKCLNVELGPRWKIVIPGAERSEAARNP